VTVHDKTKTGQNIIFVLFTVENNGSRKSILDLTLLLFLDCLYDIALLLKNTELWSDTMLPRQSMDSKQIAFCNDSIVLFELISSFLLRRLRFVFENVRKPGT